MRYICRTGCQWRSLPPCFPPWPTGYYYFAQWRADGTLERLSQASNRVDRLARRHPRWRWSTRKASSWHRACTSNVDSTPISG